MVGIRLAACRPEPVAKLVLIGTGARPEDPERPGDWRALRNTIITGSESEQKHMNNPTWLDDQSAQAANERAIMPSTLRIVRHDRALRRAITSTSPEG